MEDGFIVEEDLQWESLYKTWMAEKKPGQVVTRGGTYTVVQYGSRVKFKKLVDGGSGFYGSTGMGT